MEGVLVTGAARRVGRAITAALADDGWFVCIHYNRSAGEAETLRDAIRARGGRAEIVPADLESIAETETLVARAAKLCGGLSVLINNASLFDYDDLDSLTAAGWDRQMAVNLRAPALLARDFARLLPPERSGCIINLLDQKLWNLNPDFLSYTVSKVGLHGLTELLAMALAPRVRVCGIAPGLLLPSGKMTQEGFERAHVRTPLGRGPTVPEIVAAVRFILATPAFNGQTLTIDGGESLRPRRKDLQFDSGPPQ